MNENVIHLNRVEFSVAAHKVAQWLPDLGSEVAFAGRSNSGKSTALNAITGRKIAKTSKTPGRTQQIVFFTVNDSARLVDLPGYGFAKVPEHLRMHWGKVIERYFMERESLRGLILMMDVRHPLKPLDLQLLDWCVGSEISVHVLLTKSDKLSKSKVNASLARVRQAVEQELVSVQAFSGRTGMGVEQARRQVCTWLAHSSSES